jgi:Cu/Ag efflux pump CusA
MGENEDPVIMNGSPIALEEIGGLPIKTVNGRTIYVRDVANVHKAVGRPLRGISYTRRAASAAPP